MNKIVNHLLGGVSFGGAVIGSYIIAANIQLNFYGYIFFLASSIATAVLLLSQKDRQWYVIAQNVYFIGVNLFGLYNYQV